MARREPTGRHSVMRTYAPLFGYVYVPLGVLALALGTNHRQAASPLFVGATLVALVGAIWSVVLLRKRPPSR